MDEVCNGNFDEVDDKVVEVDIFSTHDAVLEVEEYVSIDSKKFSQVHE